MNVFVGDFYRDIEVIFDDVNVLITLVYSVFIQNTVIKLFMWLLVLHITAAVYLRWVKKDQVLATMVSRR